MNHERVFSHISHTSATWKSVYDIKVFEQLKSKNYGILVVSLAEANFNRVLL